MTLNKLIQERHENKAKLKEGNEIRWAHLVFNTVFPQNNFGQDKERNTNARK